MAELHTNHRTTAEVLLQNAGAGRAIGAAPSQDERLIMALTGIGHALLAIADRLPGPILPSPPPPSTPPRDPAPPGPS